MSKDNRINMPSGMGGIVRYFDDYKSKIEIKPGHVIVLIALIMILLIVLNTYGRSWFGI
jgi:preprotein translocase subunit Sec61beta